MRLTQTLNPRYSKLQTCLREQNFDGIVLVPGANLLYYTGVRSLLMERPFLFFIPTDGQPHLVAPAFECGPYRELPFSIQIHDWNDTPGPGQAFEHLVSQLTLVGKWGIEGRTPFKFTNMLSEYAHPKFEDAEEVLEDLREIKDEREIRCIHRAALILSKSFQEIPQIIEPKISEVELAGRVAESIQSHGGHVDDVLVQAGRSAADPHRLASSRRIGRKSGVIVDATCTYSNYYADITRTFFVGYDTKFAELYQNVLDAQMDAIGACEIETAAGTVDAAARDPLRRLGLAEYFTHRTGHGIGLEVHESPYILDGSAEKLKPKMAFTVEPGVYLPGRLGIRIEDDIVMSSRGAENITRSVPKEYGWWKR